MKTKLKSVFRFLQSALLFVLRRVWRLVRRVAILAIVLVIAVKLAVPPIAEFVVGKMLNKALAETFDGYRIYSDNGSTLEDTIGGFLAEFFNDGENANSVSSKFRLHYIGFGETRASLIVNDKFDKPIVLVPEVTVAYSINSLVNGRIHSIEAPGISIFPGNLPAFPEPAIEIEKPQAAALSIKPLAAHTGRFNAIKTSGSVFLPVGDGTTFALPFDIEAMGEHNVPWAELLDRSAESASETRGMMVRAKTSSGRNELASQIIILCDGDEIGVDIKGSLFADSLPAFLGVPPEIAGIALTNFYANAVVNFADTNITCNADAVLSIPTPFGEHLIFRPELKVEADSFTTANASLSVKRCGNYQEKEFAAGPVKFDVPVFKLSADVREDGISAGFEFKVNDISVTNAPDFAIRGLQANIACAVVPNAPLAIFGDITADAFFKDTRLAQFNTGLSQTNDTFKINAKIDAPDIPFSAALDASFDPATQNAKAVLSLPNQSFNKTNDVLADIIKSFAPDISDCGFSGKIGADGSFALENGKPSGEFKATLRDLSFDWPAKNISATNVFAVLSLPELPNISNNSLALGFKDFKAGDIELDSGTSRFRYAPPAAAYMDNLTLNWCDGKIRAESTRFSFSNQTIRVTLHADRLRLSKLLHQIGAGHDSGETGSLSGTIPVVFTRNKITFRDAYLHSTPGENGFIRLAPSETLATTAAASVETSLALDALSDFSYRWLRLGLDTKDDDLLVRLMLDGKPTKDLFYTIDRDTIKRSPVASHFEGLTLETNITLPLNKTLPYLLDAIDSL